MPLIRIDAEAARSHSKLGSSLLARGMTAPALAEFQQAVTCAPDDLAARRKVAELLARLGRTRDAVGAWQQVAGRCAADGLAAQAICVCKAILEIDPAHTETLDALASLFAKRDGPGPSCLPPSMAAALKPSNGTLEVETAIESPVEVPAPPPAPLFSDLPADAFKELLSRIEITSLPPHEQLVAEGAPGRSMYLVARGKVDVVRGAGTPDESRIAQLSEGASFGEVALAADVPRLAGIVAAEVCTLLEVTREALAALVPLFPSVPKAVGTYCRLRLLAGSLRRDGLFSALPEAEQRAIAERFQVKTARPREVLVRQGTEGKGLYLVLRGRCEIVDLESSAKHQPDLGVGAMFGETALGAIPEQTVRAATDSTLLFLPKADLDAVAKSGPAAKALSQLAGSRRDALDVSGQEAAAFL